MSFLGNAMFRMKTHTKSGYPTRIGFSEESGWTNNGSLYSQLTNSESQAILGSGYTGLRVKEYYGWQYGNNSQWEIVLTLENINDNFTLRQYPGFASINNGESVGGGDNVGDEPALLVKNAYSFTTSADNYKATWKWRGNYVKFLNNKSEGTGFEENFIAEVVFASTEPYQVSKQIINMYLGGTSNNPDDSSFNLVTPDVTDPRFISIRPRITGCFVPTASNSSPFQTRTEPNLGPYLKSTEACKVFFNIGVPHAYGNDATLGPYLEFLDWPHGNNPPTGQDYGNGGTNYMTSVDWGGKELTDATGYLANFTLKTNTPGSIHAIYQAQPVNRHTTFRLYIDNTTGANYTSPSTGTFNRDMYLEWPTGYTLHNQRYWYNGSVDSMNNRFTVTNRSVISSQNYIRAYEFPRGMILIKPLSAQRDTNHYKAELGFRTNSGSSTADLTYAIFNGYAGETSITQTEDATTGADLSEDHRSKLDLAPFGDPIVYRFRNTTVESPVNITTVAEGCNVLGDSAVVAAGANGTYSNQLIEPNSQGEHYRVQHTYEYSGGDIRRFTVEGRIIDTVHEVPIQFTESASQGGTTYGSQSGIQVKGREGVRLRFSVPTSLSESNLDELAGTFVELSFNVAALAGIGKIYNRANIIKRSSSGTRTFYHDSCVFVPHQTTGSWSIPITCTVINNDIPYQRSFVGTWSGAWAPEYSAEILNPGGGTRLDRDTQPLRWVASATGTVSNQHTETEVTQRQPLTGQYYYYNSGPYGTQVNGTNDYLWLWTNMTGSQNRQLRIYWDGSVVFTQVYNQYTWQYITSIIVGDNQYYMVSGIQQSPGNGDHYRLYRQATITNYSESITGTNQISMPTFDYNSQNDYAWVNNDNNSHLGISMDYTAGDHADITLGAPNWTGPGVLQSTTITYALASFKIAGDD